MKNFLEHQGLWQAALRAVRPLLGLLPLRRVARSDVGVSVATARAAVLRLRPDGAVRVVKVLSGRRMPTPSLCALPDGTALGAPPTGTEVILVLPQSQGETGTSAVAPR